MRFIEDRFDQFVDQRKRLSYRDMYDMTYDFRGRSVDMLRSAASQIGSGGGMSNDGSREEMRQTLPYRTEYDQMDASQRTGDKKPSWIPLIAFGIIVLGVILASILGNIIVAMIVFFGGFAFLTLYASIKNNGMSYNTYDGFSKNSRKTGIIMALIAIAAIVPLFFAGKYGTNGAMVLMMISLFTAVGIFMIIGFISYLFLPKKKYTEEISANVVAYVRTIGRRSSRSSGSGTKTRFSTSPLFEYTYRGQTYLATYDRPDNGTNAHIDLGPATIRIDPNNPEDIYNKSPMISVSGILVALVCFAIAALAVFVFMRDFKDGTQAKLNRIADPGNMISLMFASDEERQAALESMGDELASSVEIPYEVTDEMIQSWADSFVGNEGREWYYETVPVKEIYTYDNDSFSIEFDGDNFVQLSDDGDPSRVHDELLVFYFVDENESDGETLIFKSVILYLNADEHEYVGTHGEYEG